MTRQSYAPEIRIIRLMCTGRVDLGFVLHSLERGADGVIIGGCWPGECHYVTEGNYDALGNMHLCRKLLERIGVDPRRLRLEWIAASEGTRFAEVMSDFAETLRGLGPVGEGEGRDPRVLGQGLAALNRLVPFLKLLEREKLRVPRRSEDGYREFYGSGEVDRVLDRLVADKLAITRTLMLLEGGPLSTREISDRLGLPASDVSRHLGESTRQGLVRYDLAERRYALAGGAR